MKFASIGSAAVSRSKCRNAPTRQSGFTLIEALVALSLLVAFAAAFDPLLFHARQILFAGSGQTRAQTLLRTLLQAPLDRFDTETGTREGESEDMRWSVSVEPFAPEGASFEPPVDESNPHQGPDWTLYRVTAHVFWGTKQSIEAQTLTLATVKNGANH